MNRYQASSPRAVIGIAAVAMAALTLGLSLLPGTLDAVDPAARLEAAARAIGPMASDAKLIPAPIVVYGVRDKKTAFQPSRNPLPARNDAV